MNHSSVQKAQSSIRTDVFEEENEFLNISFPSQHKQKNCTQKAHHVQAKKVVRSLIDGRDEPKNSSLLKGSRSVEQILREMKSKEELRRKKVIEYHRRIQDEKQYEKKAKEFELAEKKIRNRLKIQQKKLEKHKRVLVARQQQIAKLTSIGQNRKAEDVQNGNKNNFSMKKMRSYSEQTKRKPSHSQLFNMISFNNKQSLSANKKLTTEEPSILCQDKQNPQILHRKTKNYQTKMVTLPTNLDVAASPFKKIDYLRKLPKRASRPIEQQLQSLYGKDSKECFGRAVQLVQKIQNKHRLRLKNFNEKDYRQAREKLKLLSFFYKE